MTEAMVHWIEQGLARQQPWRRAATLAVLVLGAGIPVGAILGLLGGLYGSVALLGLIVAAVMLRSLMASLLAVIAIICLLPFAALPVDIGFAPTLLNLALGTLFFVWIARLVTHREGALRMDPPAVGVLAFAALAIVSFVAGLSHATLTANVARRFGEIILSILSFLLIINVVNTPSRLRLVIGALIVCGFIAALIGIVLYVLPKDISIRLLSTLRVVRYPAGPEVLRHIEDNPDAALRATSTSVDPNVLGGLLVIVTALTLPHLLVQRPILPRPIIVAMAVTMVLCLVLTFSRSSLGGLMVAAALLGILRWRRLLWLGVAFLVVLVALPPARVYVSHLIQGLLIGDLATQMRVGEYRDAIRLISRYPWFGVGFAGTPDIDTYLGVSSVYLLIAQEMGLIGLCSFLLVLGVFVGRFLRAQRHDLANSDVEPLLYGCGVAVISAMMAGLLDHYLFNLSFPHASTLLWMLLGLGTVSIRLAQSKVQEASP